MDHTMMDTSLTRTTITGTTEGGPSAGNFGNLILKLDTESPRTCFSETRC